MVIRHGEIVHGANHHLTVFHHSAVLGGMYTQNGRLRRVDDGRGQHGAEHAAIADGESAAGHLFNAEFAVARFGTVFGDLLFDLGKAHLVGVAQNRHHQATR